MLALEARSERLSRSQESFSKKARLTRRSQFLSISRTGEKAFAPHFIIIHKNNDRLGQRLGITVSSKVGNAVIRNRVKRGLREFFRRQKHQFEMDQDTLIIARKGAGELSHANLHRELHRVIRRSRKQ